MTNPTAQKFGYPETLIADAGAWLVLLRPHQPTFGSLVLVCKEPAKAFSELSGQAFADLQVAVKGVEQALGALVGYERINYLMLMMVDPDVHFHVIPRYAGVREYEGLSFPDAGWPGQPALSTAVELPQAQLQTLSRKLAAIWPKP